MRQVAASSFQRKPEALHNSEAGHPAAFALRPEALDSSLRWNDELKAVRCSRVVNMGGVFSD
ncbi:MAG: hypothetical protein J0I96_11985 [Rhodanobacter sp.]|nr:hypothetical protein [Rhodanobacter sp.]